MSESTESQATGESSPGEPDIDPEEELGPDEVPSNWLDATISAVVLFGAIGLLFHTTTIEAITLGDSADPGPAFWPRLVLGAIIATALGNLVLVLRRLKNEEGRLLPNKEIVVSGFERRFRDLSANEWQFYLVIGLVIVYLLVLDPIGYLIATPPFLFAFGWILDYRKPGKLGGTSALVSTVIFVGFRLYMNIPLPYGTGPFRAFHLFVESLF